MKKLLVAAIGAAAAIGAFADPWYSGTSFESNDISIGDLDLTTGEGRNWTTNGPSTLAVRDITNEYPASRRSDYFNECGTVEANITKGLSIKTKFGEPAYRASDTEKTMGEVYVDVLVKPTICEDDPTTIGNDAKIAIWLKETESPAATNLMITAGYINSNGDIVQTNYNCGTYGTTFTDGAADTWQRFTIKSFATIKDGESWPAFVVFRNNRVVGSGADKCDGALFDDLDADPAAYHRDGCLFPSLSSTSTTISAIGFDGTGDVDDILFTDDAPAWATTKKITLAWDEHVTGFTYAIGTAAPVTLSDLSGAGSVEVAVDVAADIVITADSYANGYIAGTFTSSDSEITVSGKTFVLGNLQLMGNAPTCTVVSAEHIVYMTVNGTSCYSVADAITAVNGTTGAATLSLNRAITLEDAITFGSETLTGVTLDLAGQTITFADADAFAITATDPLTITNSVPATGGITAAKVVTSSANLTIQAGEFTGAVTITAGTAAITGGTFRGTITSTATGFITGGMFDREYDNNGYLALGYKSTSNGLIPPTYTVGIGTYTIEYYDGEEQLELTPGGYTFGDAELILPTPEKSGYTFNGWLLDDEPFVYVAGETAIDLVLAATWTEAAVPTFTLTAAPGANMTVAVYTNDVVGVVGVNNDYTIASNDTAKIVYTAFSGYKIEGQDTYTTNIVVEANVTVTAPTATLNTFTVTFNKNDESAIGTMNDQTFQYNVAQALTSNAFVLASHTFQGWATSAEGEVVYADGASVTLTSAGLTLYAKWASSGGEGWDPDPSAIDEKKTAAQEYPALAETPLATANAKTLTIWAEAKSIDFSAVKSATTAIVESYLLNCAPADLEDEKAAFKLDISFDASGNPVVSLPVGKEYNVTPTMKGSNDLSTWTVTDSTTGYQFFKYELSL